MRLEQRLADRALRPSGIGSPQIVRADPPRQRVAVRVQARSTAGRAGRRRCAPAAVDEVGARHDPDDEAGEVVVVAAVEVGHLGRLAADQRDARGRAAGRDAADDLLDHLARSSPTAR